MFKRNWGIILAIGLILAGAKNDPPDGPKPSQSVAEQPRQSDTQKPAMAAIPAIREKVHPTERDAGCQDRKDKRDSDLCIQWKAADAARDAADYALWSLIVGIVGTILLIWTLWETRLTSMREQRAYIRVEPAPGGIVQPDKPICIPMSLINYGTTPARKCAVERVVVVRPPDWSWEDEPSSPNAPNGRPNITIHPDSPFLTHIEMDEPLPRKIYDSVMSGESVVFARGRVLYEDVFRRSRETTFQIEFHGADKGDGTNGRLRISPFGNEFT